MLLLCLFRSDASSTSLSCTLPTMEYGHRFGIFLFKKKNATSRHQIRALILPCCSTSSPSINASPCKKERERDKVERSERIDGCPGEKTYTRTRWQPKKGRTDDTGCHHS